MGNGLYLGLYLFSSSMIYPIYKQYIYKYVYKNRPGTHTTVLNIYQVSDATSHGRFLLHLLQIFPLTELQNHAFIISHARAG